MKTASRALGGEPNVADATLARVRDAALRLGFRPKAIARELRRGARSTLVGAAIAVVGVAALLSTASIKGFLADQGVVNTDGDQLVLTTP